MTKYVCKDSFLMQDVKKSEAKRPAAESAYGGSSDHKRGGGNVSRVWTALKYCINFAAKLVLVLLVFCVLSRKAYAYIDPGTGSYIFQVMIAFLVGGLFAVKLFWKKIKSYFTELFFKEKRQEKDEG